MLSVEILKLLQTTATRLSSSRIHKIHGVFRCRDFTIFTRCKGSSTKVTAKENLIKSTVSKEDLDPDGVKNKNKGEDLKNGIHFNPCNIQMISDDLYKQLFIDVYRQKTFDEDTVSKCRKHLEGHGLWSQKLEVVKPVNFTLPELEGVDIDDHFRNIALQQTFRYRALMDELIKSALPSVPSLWSFEPGWTKYSTDGSLKAVPFPEEDAYVFDVEVCMSNGQVPTLACAVSTNAWYSWCSKSLVEGKGRDTNSRMTIDELIPFETRYDETRPPSGIWHDKIIIGHNVSYDRARIKEQYFLEKSQLRFMDTMSMHIAVSGITSFQRALKMTLKSRAKNGPPVPGIVRYSDAGGFEWNELSSLNNLADVYKLYCDGPEIKKDQRSVFVKGTLQDVGNDFQNLMSYCAKDVTATFEILQKLLPTFYERFPHPVTLCGMLEMGTTYLPINSNWEKYIQCSENAFKDLEKEVKSILMKKATEAVDLLQDEKYKEDPWLWDLDWKVPKKRSSKKLQSLTSSDLEKKAEKQYPAWYRKLLYKPGEDYEEGPAKLSASMQIVPKLLRLTWFGFPLYHSKTGGWGFLVKRVESIESQVHSNDYQVFGEESDSLEDESSVESLEQSPKFPYEQWEEIWEQSKASFEQKFRKRRSSTHMDTMKNELRNKSEETAQDLADFVKGLKTISGLGMESKKTNKGSTNKSSGNFTHSPHPNCDFIPLPHKNGINFRVGNPLAKDFLSKIEEGILSCANGQDIANRVVTISKMVSYWRNNRDRIFGQMTLWSNENDNIELNKSSSNDLQGAILPQVTVSGTLTRRAVEPTWMTASNAYTDRIGSELKGMIQAPPSFHFVGADVDSQELWIASVIGDAHFASLHGSTALGWMTLQGNKSAGTDMHSKTASMIGIGRDESKILNYARIYGAGVTFAERLLMQFNRQMSSSEAKTKAKTMYKLTKGERKYLLNEEGQQLANEVEQFCDQKNRPLSKLELQQIMDYHHYPFREYFGLVDKVVWDEGTESHMFNRLEEIAQKECPQTPILGCFISRSLVPSVVHNDYMTSRVNWVVQSSAVDYLHLMLTCMGWLMKKYDINCRLSLSVHDEVRYLVHSEDRYRAALALQVTNLFTRAFCSYRLEMYDLPQSVGFFSCVDVDKVLRKEVSHDCVTPSNPEGLKKGYNICEGEALDIWDILKLTNSSLTKEN